MPSGHTPALPEPSLPTPADDLLARAKAYIQAGRAPATQRAYQSDLADFAAWCGDRGFTPLPATGETVGFYLTDLAERRAVATLERRLASISRAHRAAGFESPTRAQVVRDIRAGIRRTKGVAPRTVAPILLEDLQRMLAAIPDDLGGARDRSLLLVGFAGGFRRSELVSLSVEDLDRQAEGIAITLRRSKVDPEGMGRRVPIPKGRTAETCPVRALESWLTRARIEEGAIFRPVNRHQQVSPGRLKDHAVVSIIRRAARRAGLEADRFAGHSLRSGLCTAAARAGASERSIMTVTGHRSLSMLRRYVREAELFRDSAALTAGL